ncbi:hypothetical protein DYB26_012630 [Aphanomyces astaci]|nr:hypothetical protein DYB38_000817 [Aphanomyces astaci]RHZ07996.1 hypothetical protein DYB26_012630 [Aphanomyces astaci]RHZ28164.1 hypothetical protein DYB31_002272 [Aphanomyces astaci]
MSGATPPRYPLRSRRQVQAPQNAETLVLDTKEKVDEAALPSPIRSPVPTTSSNAFRTSREHNLEGMLGFKEEPRQILFLFLLVISVAYYSFTHDSDDIAQNVRNGGISAAFIFLVYCFLQTRDGLLMCMFRDWRFCWVLGIGFELLELIFQCIIPDFQECWWDSLFMDLLGANFLGMCLGRLTLKYLETKEYDWSGKRSEQRGYFSRAISQFTPFSWSRYDWEVFSSAKRFFMVLVALFVCLFSELNAFFLLTTLSIPKDSNLNKYRLAVMFMLGIPAAAEYYEFVTDPKCYRLGQNAWMMCCIIVFEMLVWVKFSEGLEQMTSPPFDVVAPLVTFSVLFSLWMLLYFRKKVRNI